jgi:transposase
MLSVEGWTTIRYLHAQGKSIKAIAAELGVARNTVRLALRREGPPKYRRPPRPNPQLVPFADEIERMVVGERFIGSRILRELRKLGYAGGDTALYAYLRRRREGLPDPRLTVRFETAPGEQGQFDWSPYSVLLGGLTTKVVVFCLTLGYSRRKLFLPSLVETQPAIFEALETSWRYFGGTTRELLVDNPRAFVTNANPARFAWNRHFLELCGHYRVQPVACHPHRPRTKGKVERPFFSLEQQVIKGSAWTDLDDFARALLGYSQELDDHVHGTTGERPSDRFEREGGERACLTPLPTRPFVGSHEEVRKVSWDCLVSFGGNRYSVPWPYAAQQVWLRPSRGTHLLIRDQHGEEIARHALATRKGSTVLDPAHYAGLPGARGGRSDQPRTKALLAHVFLRRFPDHGAFVDGLVAQQYNNAGKHLRVVLALAEVYSNEAMQAALTVAREYQTYSHRFIRGVLEAGDVTRQAGSIGGAGTLGSVPALPARATLRPTIPVLRVAVDLGVYQRVLEAEQ